MLELVAVLLTIAALIVFGLGILGHWKRPVRLTRLLLHSLLLSLVIGPLVLIGIWRLCNSRTFQFFGEIVPRVPVKDKLVALTFDDGPTADFTPSVLSVLKREHVKATFFVTGAELKDDLALAKQIVADGHELGNHTYSHPKMLGKSYGFVQSELERTDNLIRAAGYQGPIHFRPPYCKKLLVLPFYLAHTGKKTITWDVEPDSDADVAASANEVIENVTKQTRPGSIILLHVMYASRQTSRAAVPGVIQTLRHQGYRFVTVSELLQHSATD